MWDSLRLRLFCQKNQVKNKVVFSVFAKVSTAGRLLSQKAKSPSSFTCHFHSMSHSTVSKIIHSRNVKIAVVIPCFKVDNHIWEVVQGIPSYVQMIVLVDDCSPGETPVLVDQIAREHGQRVAALHHSVNQGVGGATMTGMQYAYDHQADIVVKMDGDGQMDPEYLPDLLLPILRGQADFTKGNRFASSDVLQKMPTVRLIGNSGLSFLNRLASGYWNILDPTNGYFAMRSELVLRFSQKRLDKRYFYESSQLIELGICRAVVRDVPMRTIYGDEVSGLSARKALVEFPPKLLFGFCRRVWITKILLTTTPEFILVFFGFLLFAFGAIWGSYHWIQSMIVGQAATAGTVMFAALPCMIGLQMILFALLFDIQSVPVTPLCHPLGNNLPPDSDQSHDTV